MRSVVVALVVSCGSAAVVRGDEPPRPDIVLVLTDQQQGDALGVAGVPGLRTAAMDGLARHGMRFTRAFAPTPQCSPTRFALLTSRHPHRSGVQGNVYGGRPMAGCSPPADASIANLASVFRGAGYLTAYFGKWHLGGTPGRLGFEVFEQEDRLPDEGRADKAIEFIRKRTDERPALLVVSFINPHDIYRDSPRKDSARKSAGETDERRTLYDAPLPRSLADDLSTKPEPQRRYRDEDQGTAARGYGPEDWRLYRLRYHLLVEKVDRELGRVLAALEARGGEQIVVLTSDHGDLAGAHGLPYKGPAMYEELVRVPLIIVGAGRVATGVSDALVSLIDIVPTLCDLAAVPPPDGIDGLSLTPLLGDAAARLPADAVRRVAPSGRDHVIGEYYGKQRWRVPIRMVRERRWKYTRYLRYGEELYDLEADPWEMKNLAGDAAHAAEKARLAAILEGHIAETEDPFESLGSTNRDGKAVE